MEIRYCKEYDPVTRTCPHTQMTPHICDNPDCGAWNDSDHVPRMCIVCKEQPAEPNSDTCGSPRCEKFMGEYEFDLL